MADTRNFGTWEFHQGKPGGPRIDGRRGLEDAATL
jgi:hypothetical protein